MTSTTLQDALEAAIVELSGIGRHYEFCPVFTRKSGGCNCGIASVLEKLRAAHALFLVNSSDVSVPRAVWEAMVAVINCETGSHEQGVAYSNLLAAYRAMPCALQSGKPSTESELPT